MTEDEEYAQRRERWARMDPLDRDIAARKLRDAELRREAALAAHWIRRMVGLLMARLRAIPPLRTPRL